MIRSKLSELNRNLLSWILKYPTGPILIMVQGVAAWMWWVAGSYLGLDTFFSRSFSGADGWCDPSTRGLGVHCWGDYYSLTFAFTHNPESPYLGGIATAYPPAGLLFIQAFNQFGLALGNTGLGLVLYLVFMASTISWSVWKATLGLKLETRLVLFGALTFFAPPVLMVLDRGNTVGFLLPLLIWYFQALREGKNSQIVMTVALMSIIKPHFGVMVLALFISGKVLVGIKTALIVAIVNILPFIILWGSEFLTVINQWLVVFFGYQGVSSPSNPFPTNISFSHSLLIIVSGLNNLGLADFTPLLLWVEGNYGLIGFTVGLLLLLLLSVFRGVLTRTQISILIVSCISLLSGTTYMYYAIFVVPVLLTFNLPSEEKMKNHSSRSSRKLGISSQRIDIVLWLASIATLIQFPIYDLAQGAAVVTTNSLIGGVWLLAYLAIAAVLVIHNTAYRRSGKEITSANTRNS
jgi:hypothetical protein